MSPGISTTRAGLYFVLRRNLLPVQSAVLRSASVDLDNIRVVLIEAGRGADCARSEVGPFDCLNERTAVQRSPIDAQTD